jgi:hypothetical protein
MKKRATLPAIGVYQDYRATFQGNDARAEVLWELPQEEPCREFLHGYDAYSFNVSAAFATTSFVSVVSVTITVVAGFVDHRVTGCPQSRVHGARQLSVGRGLGDRYSR